MAKIKNAIIIDGVTYELVKYGNMGSICGNCDLLNQCKEQSGILCYLFPLPDAIQYHFKKVDADMIVGVLAISKSIWRSKVWKKK